MLVGLSFVDIIASFYIFLSFVHNERNARVTAAAVRNRAYGIFSMPPRGMYLEKRSTSMAKQDKISTQTDHADHAPTRVCRRTDLSGCFPCRCLAISSATCVLHRRAQFPTLNAGGRENGGGLGGLRVRLVDKVLISLSFWQGRQGRQTLSH